MKNFLVFALVSCFLRQKTTWAAYKFPANLKFAVATSAYQVEGAWNADGKGYSVWDRITHTTPLVVDGSNGDVACNSYYNWQRDVEMIKETGVQAYRFSLSWTRLFPTGYATDTPNPAGVTYYKNLIKALKANGIEPIVTIYHWDLPQTISALGGLPNPNFIQFFANFARKAYQLFGDDVKTWITFNEPKSVCEDFNQVLGEVTPWYPSGVIEYECAHDVIRAHAEAYHIYDNEFRWRQRGKVSITLNIDWSEPATNSTADQQAAEQRRQFEFGIFANPIILYGYPQIVKDIVAQRSAQQGFPQSRLPEFTLQELLRIHGTYDFLGINHYTTWLVQVAPAPNISIVSLESDIGTSRYQPSTWTVTGSSGNKVVPWGLRKLLVWLKQSYFDPEIRITECGYPDNATTTDYAQLIADTNRIDYFNQYINAVLQAIYENGVRVTLFTAWSLMDNFEWNQGYTIKFGLFYVNFTDPARTRTPKQSVQFFNNIIAANQLPD